MNAPHHNAGAIRSFVRRTARFSKTARNEMARLWPLFGVTLQDTPINLNGLFQREAPVVLEIGFGMGDSFIAQAASNPEQHFLGIEVHTPGVAKVIQDIETNALTNVRLIEGDAVPVLSQHLPPNSIDKIQVFFPDPWPKKRHHKRRLVNAAFLNLAHRVLKQNGVLHLATDWQAYADEMLQVLQSDARFINSSPEQGFSDRGDRPLTKFEARGIQLGHGVYDLVFFSNT